MPVLLGPKMGPAAVRAMLGRIALLRNRRDRWMMVRMAAELREGAVRVGHHQDNSSDAGTEGIYARVAYFRGMLKRFLCTVIRL
jgi:hypothetical protein